MQIYSIGDCHSYWTFRGISEVIIHHLGGITMKRVGYAADTLLRNAVLAINPQPSDVLIFSFGEIDSRVWTTRCLKRRPVGLESLMQGWVDRYLEQICLLHTNGAEKWIMSVVPPPYQDDVWLSDPDDTLEVRARYTRTLNKILSDSCVINHLHYLDIYSAYKDKDDTLPLELTCNVDCVTFAPGLPVGHNYRIHIGETTRARVVLQQAGLIT
jgi:hypothetical protein